MLLGIDVGYSHTKVFGDEIKFSFKSTIEKESIDISSAMKVEYNGVEYTVGENKGFFDNEVDKINSLNFKICMYTAIAKAMGNKDNEIVDLVTGLPVQYYKEQKDALKKELEGNEIMLCINNKPKKFTINKVIVFPQSAGLFLLYPDKFVGDTMVIDIGGYTIDVSVFNGKKLQKYKTFELGMNILNDKLIDEIKAKYKVVYDVLKADEIIKNKFIIKDGEKINIESLIDSVIKAHADICLNNLNTIKEFKTCQRIWTGGGSLVMKNYLPVSKALDLSEENYYDNAKAFYKIGVEKLG